MSLTPSYILPDVYLSRFILNLNPFSMKNYFLPLLISILFYNLATAQFTIESYPIDQFRLPDIDRQAMEFSGNLIGDFNSRSNSRLDHSYTTSQFQPQVGLFYSRYINREDLQAIYSVSTYPDLLMESTSNDFSDKKNSSSAFRPDLIFSGDWLKYHGNRFTSIGTLGNVFYNQHFEKQEESGFTDKIHSHTLDVLLELPVGFGTGRLEQVSDMAMALFLLNDAMQAGIDGSLISPDQVNTFAARMVTLRNERVFDTREKRIYELRELYTYMKENSWTIADDPGFFTVLTDNWLYNMNVSRLSGKRWTYEFIPSYRFSNYKSKINEEDPYSTNSQTLEGGLRATFEKYKPVNVHHDIFRTHAINLGVSRNIDHSGFNDRNYDALHAGLSTSVGQQWIPNSRTVVKASFLLNYDYTHPFSFNAQLPEDDHFVTLSLNGTANYFISYRTQFFANFTMSYNYHRSGEYILVDTNPFDIEEVDNGFHVMLNGGITVSIF